MANDIDFDPHIPVSKLPDGWTVEAPYDTSVRLNAPEGQPEHVLLQYWAEDDDAPEYLVQPMVASDLDGASAQSARELSQKFTNIENAVGYAVRVANEISR